jgi:phage baseplate assembly protein W
VAYNIKQISPLDLRPSTALGVKLPFSADNVFTSVYTTKEQYKYNVINFLLTDRGERPFNFNFGASLRSYLFEQIETQTLDSLESYIRSQVEINFNTLKVKDLSISSDSDRHSINISLSYIIVNTNENDNVIIKIQNI